ncbi:glycogen debranching N-terminal domain-containing protein [Streptomyces sp. NPDC059080]|uniref:glycogen debranching N-terminal domain-containing protein n=1 Tax=Streptomyces sp. NPDC059080 TaxID=3346718 RepID=UPI0036C03707
MALPHLTISPPDGQLRGENADGCYHDGRRILSRCELRAGAGEPVILQSKQTAADHTRFLGTVCLTGDRSPDPDIRLERLRRADGSERLTFRSSASRPIRLPVDLRLGTDLAELGAAATGIPGSDLRPAVHGAGLRWSGPGAHAAVTATPAPDDALASAGLLRWELELPPGGTRTIDLRLTLERTPPSRPDTRTAPGGPHAGPELRGPYPAHHPATPRPRTARPQRLWAARLECDDPRADALLATSLDDLHGLLTRDTATPTDLYTAGGIPWRPGLSPAEALWSSRMLLPLGTHLAAGTLRLLARTQHTAPGPDSGRLPGPLRDAGPHAPPSCTGTEATLLFPTVLAEARRWGLPDHETEHLLPTAERCLDWLLRTATSTGRPPYVPDPAPSGPYRCETQAHAHRAAVLGADLLDAYGKPHADDLREWAAHLRTHFRTDFWYEDRYGGRPAALITPQGRPLAHLGATTAHLLDTGLLGGGRHAPGLLDPVRTAQLAALLAGPAMDTGWGLRSLSAKEEGHNPFGHRSGAVRPHESAVAAAGLAAAGHEPGANVLVKGVLDASESFGHRLPEMYAGEQRTAGATPVPHPAACRPASVAAAGAVHLLLALAGLRPDVPGGTLTLRPVASAPLGALQFTGLRAAGRPLAVRISRLGMGMVEEAADGLQLKS